PPTDLCSHLDGHSPMPRLEALPVLVIAQRVTGDHGCYITAHLRVLNRLKRSRIQIHPALHVGDRQIRTILPQLLGAHLDASLQALIAIALRIHTHIRKRLAQLRRQRHLRHLQTLFARAQKPSDIFDAHRGEPLGILVAFDFSLVLTLPPLAFMVPVELHHLPARAVALEPRHPGLLSADLCRLLCAKAVLHPYRTISRICETVAHAGHPTRFMRRLFIRLFHRYSSLAMQPGPAPRAAAPDPQAQEAPKPRPAATSPARHAPQQSRARPYRSRAAS